MTLAVLLKLMDADGVVGWGEANSMQPFKAESPREIAGMLTDSLLPTAPPETSPKPRPPSPTAPLSIVQTDLQIAK
jgi:muconate cycloisomerase